MACWFNQPLLAYSQWAKLDDFFPRQQMSFKHNPNPPAPAKKKKKCLSIFASATHHGKQPRFFCQYLMISFFWHYSLWHFKLYWHSTSPPHLSKNGPILLPVVKFKKHLRTKYCKTPICSGFNAKDMGPKTMWLDDLEWSRWGFLNWSADWSVIKNRPKKKIMSVEP